MHDPTDRHRHTHAQAPIAESTGGVHYCGGGRVWLLLSCVLLLTSTAALEIAAGTGRISPTVLNAVRDGMEGWWRAPRAAHLGVAGAALVSLLLGLDSALRGRGRVGTALVALAALALCPLSPLPALWDHKQHVASVVLLALAAVVWWRAKRRDADGGLRRMLRGDWTSRGLAALCVSILVYLLVVQVGEMGRVVSRPTDFGTLYRAAAALRAGEDPYEATGGGYLYPPTFAVLLRPLLAWPVAGASLLWFLAKVLLVVTTLRTTDLLVQGGGVPAKRRALFLFGLLFVAHRFWVTDLRFGNTNVVTLALLIAAVWWDCRNRLAPAGLALALAVTTKVVPLVFVAYFLARGRTRVVAWFLAALFCLNAGAWLVMGEAANEAWAGYAREGVAQKLSERLAQPDNQSLWGALNRTFPNAEAHTLRLAWGVLAALFGVAACLSARATRRRPELAAALASSLFFLWGLLISPGSWVVHYTAVLLPLAVLWRYLLASLRPRAEWWVLFAAVNLVLTGSGLSRASVWVSIHGSLFVLAAVALFAGLIVLLRRRPATLVAAPGGPAPPASDPPCRHTR